MRREEENIDASIPVIKILDFIVVDVKGGRNILGKIDSFTIMTDAPFT